MISGSPSAQFPKLSPNEYLEWEELQREKHEYFDGQIYAMGDGRRKSICITKMTTAIGSSSITKLVIGWN
jgi:Uma2 family endonuclease